MNSIDLAFPISCECPIAVDHSYALYSALSRLAVTLHQQNGVAIHPIAGRQIGDRRLSLQPWSRLTLRTRADHIPALLPLASKQINLDGAALRIGVPQVRALEPRPALRSRLVTIKGFFDPEPFEAALRRQLDQLNLSPQIQITLGRRRTLKIKDKQVVGHEVFLEGLSAGESLVVQEQGLGGRRHMGCGIFACLK